MNSNYDVIVIGAGHAGVEAALACSRLGHKTLMITTNLNHIAYMSCNPSIGGLAKGHMVREIDVMGGEMAFAADETCIQFKRLNQSKGPAVRGTRVQSDKHKYSEHVKHVFSKTENLQLLQSEVKSVIVEKGQCIGVALEDNSNIFSKCVVVTTGTFMNGTLHFGLKQSSGGRIEDKASIGLSNQFKNLGFNVQRLKTGTPPRLRSNSIDWSKTVEQFGDEKYYPFSFKSEKKHKLKQIACYLSRTTEKTHEIIRNNLDKSPMFCGVIEGVGPRYCPSIEDKITRFSDRDSHQTFLEPEGLDTDLVYLQGISTSLPENVQDEFIKTIIGLEHVEIVRYGYAVEYDYIEPTQIWHSLETRLIKNLFFAGQINGTSGYEEAAAQGLVAGINASMKIFNKPELVFDRSDAYIGVLIDDLVTKGTKEPYRMFTSRAEHRLLLREDNTLDRLSKLSANIGLCDDSILEKMFFIENKRKQIQEEIGLKKVFPNEETQSKLASLGSAPLHKSVTMEELLRRPELNFQHLSLFGYELAFELDENIYEPIEIEAKYSGYIKRQQELISQAKRSEQLLLDENLSYDKIKGLSSEEVEKLSRIRPRTLGQAQRISGVNPSAIQSIMVYLKSQRGR